MRVSFFLRLAWTGIKKNSKLYVPYILSSIGMVMMFYILSSLGASPMVAQIKGGGSLSMVLTLGQYVIGFFSLLFLFYTNSFLVRRRYKEFGLYNILGMDKKSIRKIVFFETVIIALISIGTGIALGVLFSKLAELGLLNIVKAEIDYNFTVGKKPILITACGFLVIFLLILFKSLIQVGKMKPLELMRSEKTGEKPIRANWVFALIGLVILAAAYAIAVSIKTPVTAIMVFFIAVIMVIIATYMLFMSGSVALCKLLQKNRKYYYRKDHFVSVSSMAFRMKRNGAGLASICILATMVLVMISSSSSLYFGMTDSIKARFPIENEILLSMNGLDHDENEINQVRKAYEDAFDELGVHPDKVAEYIYAETYFYETSNSLEYDPTLYSDTAINYDDLRVFYFMSAEDYNKSVGSNIKLEKGQAMIYPLRCTFDKSVIEYADVRLEVAGTLDAPGEIPDAKVSLFPAIFVVVNDFSELEPNGEIKIDENYLFRFSYYYGYEMPGTEHDAESMSMLRKNLSILDFLADYGYGLSSSCYELERDDFVATYGGLFFIGIILSIAFIFAAAMIIYYKQISEGFEDQARFGIMKKVGMTNEDIKKSVNSQVVTVFFAPLLFAGLHLAFAFPLVWKLLQLFNLYNLKHVILVTLIAYAIFSLCYVLIYKLTARAYYNIVSTSSNDRKVY